MEADSIYEVLIRLTGDIKPTGESHVDIKRLENMKVFIQVFDKMHTVIDDIAWHYKESHYASERRIGMVCSDHLDTMGIKE